MLQVTGNNCFSCNKATKSEHAFFLKIFIIAHGLSAIQRIFCLYNYSQQRANVTPHWNWLIPNWCRQVQSQRKLKGLFAWSEVKWNTKKALLQKDHRCLPWPLILFQQREMNMHVCARTVLFVDWLCLHCIVLTYMWWPRSRLHAVCWSVPISKRANQSGVMV